MTAYDSQIQTTTMVGTCTHSIPRLHLPFGPPLLGKSPFQLNFFLSQQVFPINLLAIPRTCSIFDSVRASFRYSMANKPNNNNNNNNGSVY